ncbi:MAG: GNAT family N-acetyltransferase, partial [Candidatus Tumulicola sp.]
MTSDVRIAEAHADFQRFRDLVVEYEQSLPEDLKHSEFAREVDDLQTVYGEPGAAFVATVDGTTAGCVALSVLDASTAIVKKLFVRPAYRNLGLARRLLAASIEFARARAIARLVLDTERRRLPAAYALYLSLGFEECEPYGDVDYRCPTFMQL